ncbi:11842_t:CDS:2, partial [Cetraspora pellucida]
CLFNDIEDNKTTLDIVKNELVQYFHNKEPPKIHGAKLQKSAGLTNTMDYNKENYLDSSNDDAMLLDSELEASVAFKSNEVSTNSLNE